LVFIIIIWSDVSLVNSNNEDVFEFRVGV